LAHSSGRREGNQGKNQQVFNQALASLIFVQPGCEFRTKVISGSCSIDPLRCRGTQHRSGSISIQSELSDVGTENAANCDESAVQTACKYTHSSRRCEGNQGKNQEVFNQALASLVFVQPGKRIQNESRH